MGHKKYKRKYNHKKRKRIVWNESMIAHRYDGKMIYNFRYDFLEPLFLILKFGVVIALILFIIYHFFI
ncbi:MAG: hypothetical protein J4472_02055 [DPANN group archaeon]|nr:hypothetical protein [DPANN group archaeon]